MEEFLNTQNLLVIVSIIFYGIIFYVQKTQLNKQENILNKYEKIFSIINVDEIEKYVSLQKKSTELNYENREIELSNLEKEFKSKLEDVNEILNSSKSNLDKSESIDAKFNELSKTIEKNSYQLKKFNELNFEEFKSLYKIIEIFNTENPKTIRKVEEKLNKKKKKFDKLKRKELELL